MSTVESNLLGPEVGYVDLLDAKTTVNLSTEASFNKTPIRPSAAGKCTRELFYELMEFHGFAKYAKELKTPEVHRLLNLGHSVEWHVIKQFESLRDLFELKYKQQVLSFEFIQAENHPQLSQWVEGSLDLVFWSEKFKCVADVKSKKDGWSFKNRSTRWDETSQKLTDMASVQIIGDSGNAFWVEDLAAFLKELADPFFEANFVQLNLYANSTFLKERGVNHGAILQYNKNDSKMREIRFKPSAEVYEATLGKFRTVVKAVDQQDISLAPRDYVEKSFKCRYCSYAKGCWEKGARKMNKQTKEGQS